MKGVILAGGIGSRLMPLTKITNKHLLPIYDKPMIFYPISKLIESNIRDILIISSKEHINQMSNIIDNSFRDKASISYQIQHEPLGIAHALSLSEAFCDNSNITVLLGDNIFEDNITTQINNFSNGATIFLKKVNDPKRYGVANIRDNQIINIEEKPLNPKSDLAVTGIFIYDNTVFDIIRELKPSARNELEITCVNNKYIEDNLVSITFLNGFWTDAGTFDSLYDASSFIKKSKKTIFLDKNK